METIDAGTQVRIEFLSELSHATTAYHEAAPDGVEAARQTYLEVLRKFNQGNDSLGIVASAEVRLARNASSARSQEVAP